MLDKLLLLSMPVSDMVVLRVCLLLRQAGGGRGGLRQATEKHDDLQEAVSGCPSLMTSRKQGEKAAVKGPHQRGRRVRARARALQLRVAHREWAIAEEDVWSCSSTEQRSSGFYRARACQSATVLELRLDSIDMDQCRGSAGGRGVDGDLIEHIDEMNRGCEVAGQLSRLVLSRCGGARVRTAASWRPPATARGRRPRANRLPIERG